MAVLGRLLVASAERLDLPDVLSLDSFTAGDFKYLLKGLVGSEIPYILKGFDVINPQDAIGSQNISVRVADSVVFYPGSNSGPFFHGLEDGNPNAQPLVPELRKNAINFVYLTLSTFDTARDTRAFWDPDLDGGVGGEFTQDINTESVLKADINVSVASFPENTIPVAIVKVGPAVIESIEDARDLMFRLGTGGINPDPFSRYTFRSEPSSSYQRVEPPTEMSSALAPNPFQGADKNFKSLKEWMDVVMTKLAELGGTTFWYEDASTFSLLNLFGDALGKSFRSKGKWDHGSGTPGFLTWTEDIHILGIPDKRDIIIRAGNKTLANDEVMYIEFIREQPINTGNVSVDWFNGLNFVNGVVGAFQNLEKGDWIKKASDSNSYYLRVEEFYANTNLAGGVTSAALARSIKLSAPYAGINQTERGRYTKGVYQPSDVQVVSRGDIDLENLGGNLSWLAVRQDTIMNIANIVPTSLTIDITEADGETAKCESTVAHNLVDGDRVTITGAYAGTYVVEVESADVFYIQTPDLGDDLGVSAFYAVATTTTRSTTDGLQLESANHNFKDNEYITVAGTSSSYDDMYQIKVRSATTFSIPIPSAIPMVSTGTATLASVNVRSEFGMVTLVMGESTDIGGGDSDNIRSYVGMKSPSETKPTYLVPPSYNTLDGQANYNGATDDDLTVRVAKLTAMMADKAQDKMVRALPSSGITSINNTTNGAAQEITFTPPGGSLTFITPGSDGQYILPLPSSSPGISLLTNQVAYVEIDRNNPTNVGTFTVADIVDVPVGENIFLVAARLLGNDVYLWEGSIIVPGGVPGPGFDATIVKQNQMLKLVEGGTWSWDLGTETLTWDASAFVQVPGLANSVNSIAAGSAVLNAGEVAWVDINRVGPGGALTVNISLNSALVTTTNMFILARRETTDVIVGLHSMRLVDGESKKIYAGASDQTLEYIGATSAGDNVPQYSSENYVSDGQSLNEAISTLDNAIFTEASNISDLTERTNEDRNTKLIEGGIWDWTFNASYLTTAQSTTETGGDSVQATNSNQWFAQTFTSTLTGNFSRATLKLAKGGSPTGNIVVKLYSTSAGNPDSLLATSTTSLLAQDLPGGSAAFVFDFPNTPIVASTLYALVIDVSGVIFSGGTLISGADNTNPYGGGTNFFSNDGGSSWGDNGIDIYFIAEVSDSSYTLTWSNDAYVQIPGLTKDRNTISAGNTIGLTADGQVLYANINRDAGSPAILSLLTGLVDSITLTDDLFILARRVGDDVIIGTKSTRLKFGQSTELDAQMSNENLAYIGATSTADGSPSYSSNNYVTNGTSQTEAIGDLDTAVAGKIGNVVEDVTPELGGDLDLNSNAILGILKRGALASPSSLIEEEYIDSITLLGSQTDVTIAEFTFAFASFEGLEITYKVKQSTSNFVRLGTFRTVTNGSTISYVDNYIETDILGISFDAVISGSNIIIRYTSGTNGGEMRADIKRIRT